MTAVSNENNTLHYRGSNLLKQRLILATLSGKSVRITDIRSLDTEPGVRGYEVSLIRLLQKCSDGSDVRFNASGTEVFYRPGILHGGAISYSCCTERGLGYYLDMLMALGPFCKVPIVAVLRGITNSDESPSVDYVRAAGLPMLKRFLVVDDGLELKIRTRGLAPLGGGEVLFRCPVRKQLRAVQAVKPGMVKRIRGTVYAAKVSPAMANRTVEAAKGLLLNFLPDIYITADQTKGKAAGNSPGFGITLVAETTEGVCYAAELCSRRSADGADPSVPEDLGVKAAQMLLEEIYRGGCVDSSFQWMVSLFMALGQKDVSKYLTGELDWFCVVWKMMLTNEFTFFL